MYSLLAFFRPLFDLLIIIITIVTAHKPAAMVCPWTKGGMSCMSHRHLVSSPYSNDCEQTRCVSPGLPMHNGVTFEKPHFGENKKISPDKYQSPFLVLALLG